MFYSIINSIKNKFWARRFLLYILNAKWFVTNLIYNYFLWKRINNRIKSLNNCPSVAVIELTNRCNANCKICIRKSMNRPLKTMSDDLYKKIINDLVEMKVRHVNLTGFGEGLLDPKIAEKIKYAKSKGIEKVSMFTNGSLLNKNKQIELMEAGMDEVKFSIDSLDKKEYEDNRKLKLAVVLNNLESMIKLKKANPQYKTKIGINSVVYQKRSWKDIKQIYKKYGKKVDLLTFHLAHLWRDTTSNKSKENKNPDSFFRKYPCHLIWHDFIIRANGDTSLCCLDFNNKKIIGDLKTKKAKDIWQGEPLKTIREKHLTGQANKIALCKGCSRHINWWLQK